jgi:hypothetical protein
VLTDRWRIWRDEKGLPVIPGRRGSVLAPDRETLCVYAHGSRFVAKLLREFPAGWQAASDRG